MRSLARQFSQRPRVGTLLHGLALAALGGYVLLQLMRSTDELHSLLRLSALPGLLLSVVCFVSMNLLIAQRQVVLLRREGRAISFVNACRVIFAGAFANIFLPAGTGSDLMRLIFFRWMGNQSVEEVGGFVLLDRIVGMLGLAVLVPLCLWGMTLLQPAGGMETPRQISLVALVGLLALLAAIASIRHASFAGFLHRLSGRLWFGATLQMILGAMRSYTESRRRLAYAVLLSMAAHVCAMLGIGAIAWHMDGATAALKGFMLSPMVFLASTIPVTPANLGWTEAVADKLWQAFGLHGGVVLFLTWRTLSMLVSLLGLPTFLRMRRHQAQTPPVSSDGITGRDHC